MTRSPLVAGLLESMRPHQWAKNSLVLLPLLFSKAFRDPLATETWGIDLRAVGHSLAAFSLFCMLSSGVYLLNDVADRERDRRHPVKRLRPIAAGLVPVRLAVAAAAVLIGVALTWAALIGPEHLTPMFVTWPAVYLGLNLAYSFWLKSLVIVDCLVVAVGFGVRVHAGAAVIDVPTSSWILLCTFFLAMFLALCKRREEVLSLQGAGVETRPTMRDYDLPFLDQLISPMAALSILSYALYTVAIETATQHGPYLKFTVPFVVFCVFRYLFLVYRRREGGDPSRLLLTDPQMLMGGSLWCFSVYLALTLGRR